MPSIKMGSAMIALWSGIVVFMPRMRYSLKARYIRSKAILREEPEQISFPISES